jgi:O-methyltransferase
VSSSTRVRQALARTAARAARRIGADVGEVGELGGVWSIPDDCDPATAETISRVQAYTLTPPARIMALCNAVRYLGRAGVPGAVVECGVWRGGSMMAAALTLMEADAPDREIHLFDTFTEMPLPGPNDGHVSGVDLGEFFDRHANDPIYDNHPLDRVRATVESTGYPRERLVFVPGMVEETIPASAPAEIALLRLDTDWYESTRHELEHLYPRIARGGVLIIDDYGEFVGARKAVDEYFAALERPPLLTRVDESCRLAVIA